MCGIAGRLGLGPDDQLDPRAAALRGALRHRGPDDEGTYQADQGRVLLVQTRLAILDLSSAGHQPMERPRSGADGEESGGVTADVADAGRLVIVFNGEIYNFRELRAELEAEGVVFRTQTDTEVILALYERDGARCVERLRGMFALVIWDEGTRTAFVARDPLGIKPLYWCETDGVFAFASELRALVQSGLCGKEIDPAGLWSFLRFGSVAEPGTILRGVSMLPAGHAMEWKAGRTRVWPYWVPELSEQPPVAKPAAVAREALLDSVRSHLVSDAPVGVFLSGGIDSTVMALLAQQAGIGELRTFSIGFEESAFDESAAARTTAELLGATHREWRLNAGEGQSLIRGFIKALDQPTIDGLNTYCIAKLAHEGGCKVVLSGLGGDELLGGYKTFQRVPLLIKWHRRLSRVPGASGLVGAWLGRSRDPVRRRLGEYVQGPGSAVRAWEACRSLFTEAEASQLTAHLLGRPWQPPALPVSPPTTVPPPLAEDSVSLFEMTRYMRHQLLRDSDVMSMRWGLELRVPMVDRDLFEALGKIPSAQRLRPGKQLLVDAVPELPDHVLNQPKRGFTFPFTRWVEGEWQEMLESSGQNSPVPLTSWYQKWALFVFQQWKVELGIEN
jgi:asparagine synthase (glutamine-hydrolysing)